MCFGLFMWVTFCWISLLQQIFHFLLRASDQNARVILTCWKNRVFREQNSIRFCCVMGTWADYCCDEWVCCTHEFMFCSVFVFLQWLSRRVRRQRGVWVAARSPAALFPSLTSTRARRTCLFSTHASSVPVRPHLYSAAADRETSKSAISVIIYSLSCCFKPVWLLFFPLNTKRDVRKNVWAALFRIVKVNSDLWLLLKRAGFIIVVQK